MSREKLVSVLFFVASAACLLVVALRSLKGEGMNVPFFVLGGLFAVVGAITLQRRKGGTP